MSYTGNSIVDYLKSVGQASDYSTRTKLAQQYGISNYSGSADQNLALLGKLRGSSAGSSLQGTLPQETQQPTQMTPQVKSSPETPVSSVATENVPQGNLVNFQNVLRNITRLSYGQGQTASQLLQSYASAGTPLTNPSAIGSALANETKSRGGQIQDIYTNAISLIKEQERVQQEQSQRGMQLFQTISQDDTLRKALVGLKPDELHAWITQGKVPDSFLGMLSSAIATNPTGNKVTNADILSWTKFYYDQGYTEEEARAKAMEQLGSGSSAGNMAGGGVFGGSDIASMFADGTQGGQCGVFAHQIVPDLPRMGDTIQTKKAMIDNSGIQASQWRLNPQVGDVLILDTRLPEGHAAVVNKVNSNGTVTLTESNYNGDERVTNNRTISLNDPTIYGAFRSSTGVSQAGVKQGVPTFEQYLQQKQEEAKMSFAPNKVAQTRQEYDKLYGNGKQTETSDLVSIVNSGLTSVKRFLPSTQVGEFKRDVNAALQSNDIEGAKMTLKQAALASLPAADETSYLGRENLISQMGNIQVLLKQYKDNGGDTNIFVGTEQKIWNAIGKTKNQDLAALQSRIMQSLQNYRRSMTGVAFGEGENKEYQKLFPNGGTDYALNQTMVDTILQVSQETNDNIIRAKLGLSVAQYKKLYGAAEASLPSSNNASLSVTAPNGKTYTFPDQASLDKFKKAANIP